jgi:hypothetical protein
LGIPERQVLDSEDRKQPLVHISPVVRLRPDSAIPGPHWRS